MKYIVKPEYGARVRDEYLVIGHWDNYTIIRKSDGTLYYILDVNHSVATGTYVTPEGLSSIDKLPPDVQALIADLCEVG